jgi:ribokinase
MSVVVVGAYTRDLFMYGPRLPLRGETVNCPDYAEADGGKAANQAVAAARLGAKTWLITGLGADQAGQAALALFANEAVDISYSRIGDAAHTGVGFIIVDHDGQQLITTYAGASAQLTVEDIERARPLLGGATALLLQGEIDAGVSLAAARLADQQTYVILDPSPVEAFESVPSLTGVTILTPNEPEAAVLTGLPSATAEQVAAVTGVSTVMITRGGNGVEVFWQGKLHRVPAPRVAAVDTTGAGDAFNGALAAGLDRGLDILAAAHFACRCAAFSVARRFCIPSYATASDVSFE